MENLINSLIPHKLSEEEVDKMFQGIGEIMKDEESPIEEIEKTLNRCECSKCGNVIKCVHKKDESHKFYPIGDMCQR